MFNIYNVCFKNFLIQTFEQKKVQFADHHRLADLAMIFSNYPDRKDQSRDDPADVDRFAGMNLYHDLSSSFPRILIKPLQTVKLDRCSRINYPF